MNRSRFTLFCIGMMAMVGSTSPCRAADAPKIILTGPAFLMTEITKDGAKLPPAWLTHPHRLWGVREFETIIQLSQNASRCLVVKCHKAWIASGNGCLFLEDIQDIHWESQASDGSWKVPSEPFEYNGFHCTLVVLHKDGKLEIHGGGSVQITE